jgi:hypothetical protein
MEYLDLFAGTFDLQGRVGRRNTCHNWTAKNWWRSVIVPSDCVLIVKSSHFQPERVSCLHQGVEADC